ncbi:TPA: hypothetical protein KM432_003882 [Clostridioides difficile]|uniref:Cap15 family cyclic dinucleotide receptor domain-containing protein n=1 Tax=Clostridioides difficile TaxID=1496 RepID=UPI0009427F45|nr:hypothetical protein [Clostridioides difficile]MCW0772800.1 hypothetical protein [Clostridioides difficile]HBE8719202.1 hypothetical protein [Clostridioides difficile]
MHNYSIESNIRAKVNMYITIISVCLMILISLILKNFGMKLLPLDITINTVWNFIFKIFKIGLIFGTVQYLFDNYIWKNKYIQKIHKIPDLNGVWNGNFVSCKVDEFGNNYTGSCRMEIKQNWNKIHIISYFNESTSYSRTATIKVNGSTGIELEFSYENKAEKTVNENMKAHNGNNILIYNETDNKLNGTYYTDGNRKTNGTISISR